jgi:hypothetical protein
MSLAANIADDQSSGTPRRGPSRTPARHRQWPLAAQRPSRSAFKSTRNSCQLCAPACPSESRSASSCRPPSRPSAPFGLRLHAGLQIDAVRPDVDVMARRQITLLPSPIFVLRGHQSIFGIESARLIQTLRWTQVKSEPRIRHGECLRRRLFLTATCSRTR